MEVTYDSEANTAYLSLREKAVVAKTIEVTAHVILDMDEDSQPIGVELLYPARELPLDELQRLLSRNDFMKVRGLWSELRRALNTAAIIKRQENI